MALRPLSKAPDLRLPAPAFDVRGWQVRTETDDQKVGKVDDMLLDNRESLRFLDVDLGFLKKHVLVPATRAHVDATEEVVWIEGVTKDRLEALPEYGHDPAAITSDYEQRLDAAYSGRLPDEAARRAAEQRARAPGSTTDGDTLPLARLGDLDEYRVSDKDPRGWDMITAEGQKVGEVKELLVDTASMRARYMVCDIDEKGLELEPLDRHVLLPVDRVHLNPDKKKALVNGLFRGDLATYPVYAGLPLTREQADELERHFPTAGAPEVTSSPRAPVTGDHFFAPRMGEGAAREPGGTSPPPPRPEAAPPPERPRMAAGSERTEEERLADEERERQLGREGEGDAERTVMRARDGERTTVKRGDDEVRVEVQGDDVVIDRRPRS